MKRGSKRSPEAIRDYRRLQRHKRRYQELREELQLAGVLPTEPDGALHNERVDPADQTAQALPALVAEAIRKGWSVPAAKKPVLVDEMISVIDDPEESNKIKIAAFNALRMADRSQWEQDNPKEAGLAKGSSTTIGVSVQANMLAVQVMREAFERDTGGGETALSAPDEPSPLSNSRFDGQVEVGAASTSYQRDAGEGVADAEQSDINYSTLPAREEPPV